MKYSLLSFFLPFTRYPYEGLSVPCPGCRHDRYTKVSGIDRRLKRLITVACDYCGLLYTNPMPTGPELSSYYADFYRFDYQAASKAPKQKHLVKRKAEAAARARHLEEFLSVPARTLDFGCGSGEFVTAMLERGHDAHGFEPGETYGNHAKSLHGERISIKGWQDVTYTERFDMVTCFHVLEHLSNPVDALRQMAEWSAPDGLVYIEVPDLGSLAGSKGFGALHFAHLLGFNQHNLIVAAALAGLVPEKIISPTGILFRHATGDEASTEAEAAKGVAVSRDLHSNGKMVSRYFRHQYKKLTGGYR